MTTKKISAILTIGVASSILSLSLASAMEMMDATNTSMKDTMKNKDTMMDKMDNTMKKSVTTSDDMMMYEKINPMSSKEDITKIQMMLVEKGHLVMPKGVAYGYYGKLTKAAYAKYKKTSMTMKGDSMMKTDTMEKDTMMTH